MTLRPAFAIAGTTLRRFARDRISLFFMVLLPVLVIVIIGATAGGHDSFRVAVADRDGAPLAADLVAELRATPTILVDTTGDATGLRTRVRRGERDAGVVVPAGWDAGLRAGRQAVVTVVVGGDPGTAQAITTAVSAAVARVAARVQAATFAATRGAGTWDSDLATARRLQASSQVATVRTDVVDSGSQILPAGFGYSAPTMLVLFVFVNALAGGAAMIQTRRLGLHARVMAAPVRPAAVVLGEGLGYLVLTLAQSLLIVVVGAAFFGVSWGDPWAAAALVAVWALVGTGAGMLSGTVFRTPEQASAIGPALGIGLGMLGGCMWPLAILAPAMRTAGHLAPQAWAVDAWTTLLSRDGHLTDVARPLLVLTAVALTLLAVAAVRLRRRLLL